MFSPRMRGCSETARAAYVKLYVFPAYAGMFRISPLENRVKVGFPRVCGDVPCEPWCTPEHSEFSPRMRGCSEAMPRFEKICLVFPAYAGMFRRARSL